MFMIVAFTPPSRFKCLFVLSFVRFSLCCRIKTLPYPLIRPSATFSPSNAEKGNLMGEGYEGESSAASLKNLRRDGPDGQPHLKWICSSFAPLSLGAFALNAFLRQCCGNLSKGSKGSNRIFALFCLSGRRPGRCLTGRRWFPLPAGEHRGRKSLLN